MAVVRLARFHPVGRRPLEGGNADGGYCNIDLREYLRQAKETVILPSTSKIRSRWRNSKWLQFPAELKSSVSASTVRE
jgi:hypothetical protein